jgi:hypothetical protein
MEAEQLYESLLVATKAGGGTYEQQIEKKGQWLSQFTVTFGNDEGAESTTFDGTIPQVLMMMNGDLTKTALNGPFMQALSDSHLSIGEKVNYLYLTTLGRKATSQEMMLASSARGSSPREALEDIFWALLNSNEFIFNH